MAQTINELLDPNERPAITADQFIEITGIARGSVYRGIKRGEIPSVRIGRRLLIPTAAVRKMFMLDKEPGAAASGPQRPPVVPAHN